MDFLIFLCGSTVRPYAHAILVRNRVCFPRKDYGLSVNSGAADRSHPEVRSEYYGPFVREERRRSAPGSPTSPECAAANKKCVATTSEPFPWESRPRPRHPDPRLSGRSKLKGCAGTLTPMKYKSRGL